MTKASEYHKEGYNCAEAMIKAYNEQNNTNIPISLGSGMGTGFAVGSMCGAVGAAAIIIGFLRGREDNTEQNEARMLTKELMLYVKEEYNTDTCKDLKMKGISCAEIIDYTFDSVNKIINK